MTAEENYGVEFGVMKKGTTDKLTEKKEEVEGHYSITYDKNENKGTATLLLTGNPKMGYTGTKKLTFKNVAYDLNKLGVESITLKEEKVEYTTGGATPKVIVKDKNDNILVEGKDYTLSYKNNKKVLDKSAVEVKKAPTVIVKGKGNYAKTTGTTFSIVQKDINVVEGECPVTISVKDKVHKKGKNNWKPSFKVLDENKKAISKAEYDVTYTLNGEEVTLDDKKEAAIGDKITITVTFRNDDGEGNYTGTVSETYRMIDKKYDISKVKVKLRDGRPIAYTGKAITFTPEDFKELKLNNAPVDFETVFDVDNITYENNINKGTAKVILKGNEANGYGGEKVIAFKISQRSIVDNWWEKLAASVQNLFVF